MVRKDKGQMVKPAITEQGIRIFYFQIYQQQKNPQTNIVLSVQK